MSEPDDAIDVRELRTKARTLGYRIRKDRHGYEAVGQEGSGFVGDLKTVAEIIDALHSGNTITFTTECGIPLFVPAAPSEPAQSGGGA
jgi:hypothetical protein